MFAYERHQRIKQILFEKKTIDVFYLSKLFNVSETTIRRDFDKLEELGFLKKTYGGAVLAENLLPKTFEENQNELISGNEKLISGIALKLIGDNQAIFLSGGSICENIANELSGFGGLTVITNDLSVAGSLKNERGVRLIMIGGMKQETGTQLTGELAELCLSHMHISQAFVCADGVSLKSGFSCADIAISSLLRRIREVSHELIMMADASRFNYTALSWIGDLTIADRIVTNNDVDEKYKYFCAENNIKLYTTYEF